MVVHGKVIKLLITILMVGCHPLLIVKIIRQGKTSLLFILLLSNRRHWLSFFPSTADLVMRLQSASMLIQLSESACPTI